jgi:hypothetical protein
VGVYRQKKGADGEEEGKREYLSFSRFPSLLSGWEKEGDEKYVMSM